LRGVDLAPFSQIAPIRKGTCTTDQDATPNAAPTGTLPLGEDLVVNRLGFGAMRLTGNGVWGEPEYSEEARRVLRRRSNPA
jgi:pyridoxine 4-dehydrogenase